MKCSVLFLFFTGLSIFTLTALSIDRVLVISQSLKLWQTPSVRITVTVIIVWVLAILVAIPDAVGYCLVYYEDDNTYICTPFPQEWKRFNYDKIYSMAHITLFFFVPLIIITICYGIMAHVMVKSSHGLPGETYNGSTLRRKQIRTRRKVANIMIALIFLFFVCWLPRSILTIHRIYATNPPYTPTIHFLRLAAVCLMFASGCVNPIVLYFLSKSFKTHFNKQLCCREGTTDSSTSDLATIQDSQPLIRLSNQTTGHRANSNHGNQTTESTEQTDLTASL
ncbi:NMBR [Bugula neritina]|uniref:NMBR n=1 Tax=Bugula neritina TaxID=10212 RepID=A0A7J7JAY7_BUGNE|nr:NMBR [Bugula neritina]